MQNNLITQCWCGSTIFAPYENNLQCHRCGTVHTPLRIGESAYADFYTTGEFHEKYQHEKHVPTYVNRYDHDKDVAKQRYLSYNASKWGDARVLDVGCGNGAFHHYLRERGIDAYGQDLWSAPTQYTYSKPLHECNFPTEYFKYVTCHDVLEHVLDLEKFITEIARICSGTLILDYPDFFVEEGKHHWKPLEHIWMMPLPTLINFLEMYDFRVTRIEKPIPGKLLLYADRVEKKRVKILVPPGIGDSYWSLVKIRDFCRTRHLGLPEVWVCAPDDKRRSDDFVSRVPFVKFGGYLEDIKLKDPIWKEAYLQDGRTVFENVYGCDYFLAANGILRFGRSIEDDFLPECTTEWKLPLFISWQEHVLEHTYKKVYGNYTIAYFLNVGMYKKWLEDFDVRHIYFTLNELEKTRTIVLPGASWDVNIFSKYTSSYVDMVGKTTFGELFALLRGCKSILGYPSGLTILGTSFDKPTLLLWNKYFDPRMWVNCIPAVPTYAAMNTEGVTQEGIIRTLSTLENMR